MGGQICAAAVTGQADIYIESVGGELALKALGPFNDGRPGLQSFIQADLIGLVGAGETIEVEMGDRQVWALIELDQGKGGGGDIFVRSCQGTYQGPGQGGLARSQRPRQAQGVSWLDDPGNGDPQAAGRGLIRQVYAKG